MKPAGSRSSTRRRSGLKTSGEGSRRRACARAASRSEAPPGLLNGPQSAPAGDTSGARAAVALAPVCQRLDRLTAEHDSNRSRKRTRGPPASSRTWRLTSARPSGRSTRPASRSSKRSSWGQTQMIAASFRGQWSLRSGASWSPPSLPCSLPSLALQCAGPSHARGGWRRSSAGTASADRHLDREGRIPDHGWSHCTMSRVAPRSESCLGKRACHRNPEPRPHLVALRS